MHLFDIAELERCEIFLAQGSYPDILPELQDMATQAQTYIDETYDPGDTVQWFSFASQFELLTYKRVEKDPRDLRPAARPFDRLFADLGYCLLQLQRYEESVEAYKQAVRWNPMECSHRLNLATALVNAGNYEEYLRMTFSVFERASHAVHLARAYANFAGYFIDCEQPETAAACVKAGLRLVPQDAQLLDIGDALRRNHQRDWREQSDGLCASLLEQQGIPEGANAEVAVSALLLSELALESGDSLTASQTASIATDLMGTEQAEALARIIAEVDGAADAGAADAGTDADAGADSATDAGASNTASGSTCAGGDTR